MKLLSWITTNVLCLPLAATCMVVLVLQVISNERRISDNVCLVASTEAQVIGQVVEIGYSSLEIRQLIIETTSGARILANYGFQPNLKLYADYQFGGRISKPKNSTEFSYADYLAAKGICQLLEINQVKLVKDNFTIASQFATWKANLISRLVDSSSIPLAAVTSGLVLGEDHLFSEQQAADFQNLGLSHVTAVSGANFVLVIGIFQSLFKHLDRRLNLILMLLVAVSYLLLLGISNLAATRACFFVSSIILQKLTGRIWPIFLTVVFSLVAIEFLQPGSYRDIGLQLSLLAWALLRIFLGGLLSRLKLLPEILRTEFLAALFASSILLPINLIYFGQVNLFSIIANFLLLSAFGLLTLLSWGWLALVSFSLNIASLLQQYFELITERMFAVVNYLAQFSWQIKLDSQTLAWVLIVYLLVIAVFLFKQLQPYANFESKYKYIG